MTRHEKRCPSFWVTISAAILILAPTAPAVADTEAQSASSQKANAITLIVSGYANGQLHSIWESPFSDWTRSNFIGTAVSREFAQTGHYLSWELEGQAIKHFGKQDHIEFTGAVAARWKLFPWNDFIVTTAAVAEGLSYATEIPTVEKRRNRNESKLLNYIFIELTFALPSEPDVALVARLHHRSGVFGLFNGVRDGSNFLGAGIRWRF
jgi:hypothetical protein